MSKLEIYDTTLRDGSQGEGISFSLEDKLKILKCLDDFRMDFVEGGWPGSKCEPPSSPFSGNRGSFM
jgi:2-isopropylmalate synthase